MGSKRVGVLGLWLVACSGGGSEGKSNSLDSERGDAAAPDAAEPEPDAAIADEPEPDAAPADELDAGGEPDASDASDAATSEPAFQFDVAFDGVPGEPLKVVLHGPDGAGLAVLTTDASGHAESAEAPAYATVILRSSSGGNAFNPPMPFTYAGIRPGDHLRMRVRDGGYNPDISARGEIEAAVQSVNIDATWNTVQLEVGHGACRYGAGNTASYLSAQGELPPALTIGNFPECGAPPLNLLATVLDIGEGQQTVGYSFLRNVPPPTADGPSKVSLPPWSEPSYLTLQPANVPAAYRANTGSVHMLVDGERFDPEYRRVPVAGALTGRRMPFAAGFGEALEVMGFTGVNPDVGLVRFLQVIARAPAATTIPLDFAIPETTGTDFTAANDLVLSRSLSGAFAGADAQIFTLTWSYDTGDGVLAAPWYVIAPADASAVTTPLPPGSTAGGFDVDTERVGIERVVTVSDDGLDGYEAFKARTAFIDLARGLPSEYQAQLQFGLTSSGFDLQGAIDLAPRGNAGTVRISGAGSFAQPTASARVIRP